MAIPTVARSTRIHSVILRVLPKGLDTTFRRIGSFAIFLSPIFLSAAFHFFPFPVIFRHNHSTGS